MNIIFLAQTRKVKGSFIDCSLQAVDTSRYIRTYYTRADDLIM
jgi:hypothetical protein